MGFFVDSGPSLGPLELQARGARWQHWLDNPTDTSCPVQRSTLTLETLALDRWMIDIDGSLTVWQNPATVPLHFPPASVANVVANLGFPSDRSYRRVLLRKATRMPDGSYAWNKYVLVVGPGVIFATLSRRYDGPNWSEIALAVYRHFETESIRYVFRVDVMNGDAEDLVRYHLHEPGSGLRFEQGTPRAWSHGTPEYQALLGTVNCRGVAALVLGEFDRGTKKIPEIFIFANPLQMLQIVIPVTNV